MSEEIGINRGNTPKIIQNRVNAIPQQNVQNAKGTQNNNLQRSPLQDEFHDTMRQNTGLIERFYDWIKNSTGSKLGSDSIKKDYERTMRGEISEDTMKERLESYRTSQESSAQILGDAAATAVGGGVFAGFFGGGYKSILLGDAAKTVKADAVKFAGFYFSDGAKKGKFLSLIKSVGDTIVTALNSKANKKFLVALWAGFAAISAGYAKMLTGMINRAGSNEFKKSDNPDKWLRSKENKELFGVKVEALLRDFVSGALNGLAMPLMTLGGWVGAPLYVAFNSLNRYFIGHHTSENKSVDNYFNHLKSDAISNGIFSVATAAAMIKEGNSSKLLEKNLKKATEKIKDVEKLVAFPVQSEAKEAIEMSKILLTDGSIKSICPDVFASKMPSNPDKIINNLTKENIIALKFLQISGEGELAKKIEESCPPSRTIAEAKTKINQLLGSEASKYNLENLKLAGVGTIAETYFAKAKDGSDVCIKIVKEGVNTETINKSIEKCRQIINGQKELTEEKRKDLIESIERYASDMKKELNLRNEMENAQKLKKSTKHAKIVTPIWANNDGSLYVMERVKDSMSLSSFLKMQECTMLLGNKKDLMNKSFEELEKLCTTAKEEKERKIYEAAIHLKKLENLYGNPDFCLDFEKSKIIAEQYSRIIAEQFDYVAKEGENKVTHADIHSGNICINLEALKAGDKEKLFTLIDTGNISELDAPTSLAMLNFSGYIEKGYVKGIVDSFLTGAKFTNGMTKEKATQLLTEDLNSLFFDGKRGIENLDYTRLIRYLQDFAGKNGFSSQVDMNLAKARLAAGNSQTSVYQSLGNGLSAKNQQNGMPGMFVEIGKFFQWSKELDSKIKQETIEHNKKMVTDAKKLVMPKDIADKNDVNSLVYMLKRAGLDFIIQMKKFTENAVKS